MKAFGFLSFGHYANVPGSVTRTAGEMLHQSIELAQGADEIGVNGAYVRVHHFARQAASPMPLLSAMAATTQRIEVGTGVIDMRYENPLYFAEEAAALDYIADGRIALGVSRGSPETALRGYEAFGYVDDEDRERGGVLARDKFDLFLEAIDGAGVAPGDPRMVGEGRYLPVEPRSATLRDHIWWGSGIPRHGRGDRPQGPQPDELNARHRGDGPAVPRAAARADRFVPRGLQGAGHTGAPRVSVSRSVFPLINDQDRAYFGLRSEENGDQIGVIDGFRSTFGKTYAAEPDVLIAQLKQDEAVMSADTLMLTIPNQLGPEYNLHVLQAFAEHVAPALGWKPNTEGPVQGDPVG